MRTTQRSKCEVAWHSACAWEERQEACWRAWHPVAPWQLRCLTIHGCEAHFCSRRALHVPHECPWMRGSFPTLSVVHG
jgi:hypothetical protein